MLKYYLKYYLIRPLSDILNIERFSRPSLNNLDTEIERLLNFDQGVFLEIGANDGYSQSNTYYFEQSRNWSGILIEPIPRLYKRCKKLRTNSEVFNYICTKPEDSGNTKVISYANLMSQVEGTLNNHYEEKAHIERGLEIERISRSRKYKIKCKTLSEIIDESSFEKFDFMSIDVEGHELEVLKGLDLNRHIPEYLLVEVWPHQKKEIVEYLSTSFKIKTYLSGRDILFKKRNL